MPNTEQNNRALRLQEGLRAVDQTDADVLAVERGIARAIALANHGRRWSAAPLAPLAEPVDLDALIGPLINGGRGEIRYQAQRLDTVYRSALETSNSLKASMETIEKAVTDASTELQDVMQQVGAENRQYYWVSDTFNSAVFVDPTRTTAQVDSDYGMATLGLREFSAIESFGLSVDTAETKGLPGCNMLVLDEPFGGTKEKEPQVFLETLECRALGNLLDGDPTTWFEVERNFVAPTQRLRQLGRAWHHSAAGEAKDVQAVTKGLDWNVNVQWGEGAVDAGPGDKGYPIAEPIDLDKELQGGRDPMQYAARIAIELSLDEPTQISALKLTPFVRDLQNEPVRIESLKVLADGRWIDVARDVELGSNRDTTRLQRDVLRRTGVQSTGSLYFVPTDRGVTRVRITLSSRAEKARYGLAHAFKDLLHWHRSERNHGLWRSADEWETWKRDPINKTPPTLVIDTSRKPRLTGSSTISGLQSKYYVGYVKKTGREPTGLLDVAGGLLGAYTQISGGAKEVTGVSEVAKTANALASIGGKSGLGGAGFAGAWLGKSVPLVGGVIAGIDAVSQLFSYGHTEKVKDGRQGFDVFDGYRAGIGLRDVAVVRATYESSSTLYSVKRSFPGPVSKVGLFVEEHVPEGWGEGDWIQYSISENGTDWSPLPKLTDTSLEQGWTPSAPVTDVYLRAEIKGNDADPFRTPTLQHYALQGLPAS